MADIINLSDVKAKNIDAELKKEFAKDIQEMVKALNDPELYATINFEREPIWAIKSKKGTMAMRIVHDIKTFRKFTSDDITMRLMTSEELEENKYLIHPDELFEGVDPDNIYF